VRICAAPSEHEFSSSFTVEFYQVRMPFGTKIRTLRAMQAMAVRLAEIWVKEMRVVHETIASPALSALFYQGSRKPTRCPGVAFSAPRDVAATIQKILKL
jgi:hypothetical protein